MWARSTFEDLVQYNDGFKTGLIGTAEQVADRILELKKIGVDPQRHRRQVRFAVNAFVIARETEKEAVKEYEEIVEHADLTAIENFKHYAKGATGMWSGSVSISDFVANNEGFRTGLIGSYQQVRERIDQLKQAGIDLVLMAFRFPLDELRSFQENVIKKR